LTRADSFLVYMPKEYSFWFVFEKFEVRKSSEPPTPLTDVYYGFLQLLQTFLQFLQTNAVTPHSLSSIRIHQMRSYCDAEWNF
jgi:hypothetical protein